MSGPVQYPAGAVVVHVHGSWPDTAPSSADPSPRQESGQSSGALANFPHAAHAAAIAGGDPVQRAPLDPYKIHRGFPARWRAFLHATFRNAEDVARNFNVSDRAARKWWNGEGGVNGGYVAVAMQANPGAAATMLFAAE